MPNDLQIFITSLINETDLRRPPIKVTCVPKIVNLWRKIENVVKHYWKYPIQRGWSQSYSFLIKLMSTFEVRFSFFERLGYFT
jgi:hypothetical protein